MEHVHNPWNVLLTLITSGTIVVTLKEMGKSTTTNHYKAQAMYILKKNGRF